MADTLAVISQLDNAALLSGIFNVNLENAKFTNSAQKTTYFYVQNISSSIPAANYIAGLIATYEMAKSVTTSGISDVSNKNLFNTTVTTNRIAETFVRKGIRQPIPFQNYDIPINAGTGGQDLVFTVIFCGTQYMKAFYSAMEVLFDPTAQDLGTLVHPFYGTINNCLPRRVASVYESSKLNCVCFDLLIETSDIKHLTNNNNKAASVAADIAAAWILTQTAAFGLTAAANNVQNVINSVGHF